MKKLQKLFSLKLWRRTLNTMLIVSLVGAWFGLPLYAAKQAGIEAGIEAGQQIEF